MNRLNSIRFCRSISSIAVRNVGKLNTINFKSYAVTRNSHRPLSFIHDIDLHSNDNFNMIVEIPRWSNSKLEMSTSEPFNPIIHDTKNGKLRDVSNIFPYNGYICNYGALPQTWEDPSLADKHTGLMGDNDPLDVCEIGGQVGQTGQVKPVKVLGCLGLIDEGETDWKIIVISENDPRAPKLNDIQDVEVEMPGLLDGIRTWFRNYKIPDGKPPNEFSFNGEYKNKQFASGVIKECHENWKRLIMGKAEAKISTVNSTVEQSPFLTNKHVDLGGSVQVDNDGGPLSSFDPSWHFVPNRGLKSHR